MNKPAYIRMMEDLLVGHNVVTTTMKARYGVSNPNDLIYKIRKLGVSIKKTPLKNGGFSYSLDHPQ